MIELFPSKPGVNCRTTEKGSIFVTANFEGGEGRTGSTPDWMVASLTEPVPLLVLAATENL